MFFFFLFRVHFRYICLIKSPPRHTDTEGKEVDLENRLIHVRNAVKPAGNIPGASPSKSKAGIRDVPINNSLLDILRRCSSKQGFGITGERNAACLPAPLCSADSSAHRHQNFADHYGPFGHRNHAGSIYTFRA